MLNKKNVPNLDEINLFTESEDNKRYLAAIKGGKLYRVRIPLHDFKLMSELPDEQQDRVAAPYVRQLMVKIAKNAYETLH